MTMIFIQTQSSKYLKMMMFRINLTNLIQVSSDYILLKKFKVASVVMKILNHFKASLNIKCSKNKKH